MPCHYKKEETHQMRLLLFMFVTHNLRYSLDDFILIIIGKLDSSVIRRTHSSVSAPTSLITICVWSAFQPHRKKLPCSVNSTVRHTGQLPSNLTEQPIILQCNGIVGSGSLITTQTRSAEWKSVTVKSAEEYSYTLLPKARLSFLSHTG